MTPLLVVVPLLAANCLVMAITFWFRIPAFGSAFGAVRCVEQP